MPQVSFAGDIKPLFRAIDISHMKLAGVKLDDYTYMSDPSHANNVLATLSSDLLLHCRSACHGCRHEADARSVQRRRG